MPFNRFQSERSRRGAERGFSVLLPKPLAGAEAAEAKGTDLQITMQVMFAIIEHNERLK